MSAAKQHDQGGGSPAAAPTNRTRAGNIPALERATGRAWNEWIACFESNGANKLGHTEIARLARTAMPEGVENPEWWAQGAAIAYEQHAGLRVPGQSSSGTFRVSASRTLPLDRDAAIEAWAAAHGGPDPHAGDAGGDAAGDALAEVAAETPAHLGHAVRGARRSRTEKRSFLRFELEGAGRVEVAATPKGEKVTLSVNHEGLPDGDRVEEWRTHWKALLAAL